MKDETLIKIAGLAAATAIGCAYFAFVQKDGIVLASVTTLIGTIIGHSLKHSD